MEKVYSIHLDSIKIGTTKLEKGDAPMGVATGKIDFIGVDSPYTFFKEYCIAEGVTVNTDDIDHQCIDTQVIPGLKVFRPDGIEIIGVAGNTIGGMSIEGFEISVLGISSPSYEEEFPHHVKTYKNMFKK